MKKGVFLFVFIVVLSFSRLFGQETVFDQTFVQNVFSRLLNEMSSTAENKDVVSSGPFLYQETSPSYDSSMPLISLRLNRTQFHSGEMLEATAQVIPNSVRNLPVNMVTVRVHPESGESKFYRWTRRTISYGDDFRIQTLLFDGTEKPGFYVFALFIYDEQDRLIAMPNANFLFEGLGNHNDQGYASIHSAEYIPGVGIRARGNFFQIGAIDQFLVVGGIVLIPVNGNNSEMWFAPFPPEKSNLYLPAGNWDLVYIIKNSKNVAYDSRFLPGGLRVRVR